MVLLALHGGLRCSETFNLKWDDVCFERKTLTVTGDKIKFGKTRHTPLNSEANNLYKAWRQQSAEALLLLNQNIKSVSIKTTRTSSWLNKTKVSMLQVNQQG